ncbi:MAG: biotin/lipoate--protein ligase family protein [Anderseniella sp.]|nr:biotin/lipoate--protein ligase family protein [Anderseniella sp.]
MTNLLASTDISVTMLEDPQFPPLLKGHAVAPGVAASACALEALRDGNAGAGDLFWSRSEDRLNMAVVLEPDVALSKAAQMQHVMTVAFGDAFGAISPPEISVHVRWPGDILVNGAKAGEVVTFVSKAAAADDEPDWMVVSLDVAITLDLSVPNPGERMDSTTLHEEGAGEVDRTQLLESVSRHFLTWIDTWQHEGFRAVHDNWTGRLPDDGKPVTVRDGARDLTGEMTGLDEDGNLLFKTTDGQTAGLALLDAMQRVG